MTRRTPYQDLFSEAEKKGTERKKYTSSRGLEVKIRNHHLTDIKLEKRRKKYKEFIKNVSQEIKQKAGSNFFNPYRQSGVYFGCVQALFMLGANEWFSYKKVEEMMEKVMTIGMMPDRFGKKPWEKFKNKTVRKNKNTGEDAISARDLMGRIQHNMRVLQRFNIGKESNPYGYKLAQAFTCIDIQVDVEGLWSFCLNTNWKKVEEIKPKYIKMNKEDHTKGK